MKKTIISLIMVSMIMALPLAGFAASSEDAKKDYKQAASEALAKGWTKIKNLNINGVIENKKTGSDQRVHVKDSLKVDLVAIFRGNAVINGVLKNTLTDTPLKIDDALRVAGLADFEDFVKTAALRLNPTDVSALDTSLLVGGEIYYDSTEKITYLWERHRLVDLAQQNSNTVYTAGNGIAIDNEEITTDESYSHTWTTDQNFSEDVAITGQMAINGASVNDAYGLNMGTYDENGERGQNMTVSADTEGDTVYGSYYNIDSGSPSVPPVSENRIVHGIEMDLTAGSGYNGGFSAYGDTQGIVINVDATDEAEGLGYTTGQYIKSSDYSGINQNVLGLKSYLKIGGTDSKATGIQSDIKFEVDAIAQPGTSLLASGSFAGAGDVWKGLDLMPLLNSAGTSYGLYYEDISNTGGTAYGAYIDLDDGTYDAAYSFYAADGSAPSTLGNLMQVLPTSAPPETCDATWKGSFYNDTELNLPCYCNGTNWLQMDDFLSVCS